MIFWKEWKGSTATRISWSELTALSSSAACCDPEVAVLSDLDLPVEIVPKNGNWDQLQQENQERVEELVDRGRKFRNILEIYAHWHREVFRFLKGRSRVVSLAYYAAEKSLILRVSHRMLLGEDEPPPVEAAPRPESHAKSGRRPRGCPF